MAAYYINSDRGKELANSMRAGDMAEASDGSLWRKEADGSISVIKSGQTMTGRVGVSPSVPSVSDTQTISAPSPLETPALDAARRSSPSYSLQQKAAAQVRQNLASEKAKQATQNVTSGLTQENTGEDLLAQATEAGSYTIGSAKGVLMTDKMQNAGDMAEASDGSLWKRNADGSISVTKNGKTYTANVDRAAAKQDPQWAVLTAPPAEESEDTGTKKSKKKSSGTSSGSGSSGSLNTYFSGASTSTKKETTQAASSSTGGDIASLRKKAASAQKDMGDIARQIAAKKAQGKTDTAALEAKYAEAKGRYDSAMSQINGGEATLVRRATAPEVKASAASGVTAREAYDTVLAPAPERASVLREYQSRTEARQAEEAAARAAQTEGPTLLEAATRAPEKQAAVRKAVQRESWRGLPTVADADRFSVNRVSDAAARKEAQKNAWRSLPTVRDSERFNLPSQTDSLIQQAIAQTPRTLSGKPYLPENDGGFSHSSGTSKSVKDRLAAQQMNIAMANDDYDTIRRIREQNNYLDDNESFKYLAGRAKTGLLGAIQGVGNALSYLFQAKEPEGYDWDNPVMTGEQFAESVSGLKQTFSFADTDAQKFAQQYAGRNIPAAQRTAGSIAEGVAGMIPTIASNIAVPGSSLYVLFTQAAGSATTDALQRGASGQNAVAYGVANGALEVLTEKMFDGVAGVFGKGAADDALQSLVRRVTQNEGAQNALLSIADSLGEGFEEFVSEFGDKVLADLLLKDDDRNFRLVLADAGESFLVGALTSAVMQAAGSITKNTTPKKAAEKVNDILQEDIRQEGINANVREAAQQSALDRGMLVTMRPEAFQTPAWAELLDTQQTTQATVERGADGVATGGDTNKTASAYTETESTSVNDNPAVHTPQEQAVIEAYKNSTDESLKETFQSYLDNPRQGFSRHNINDVSERQAADASKILGGDYTGYKNAINSNGINHILNEHGPFGEVNQSMADLNDPARVGYVLRNYDTVERATYSSGDADMSAEFRDANNNPAPMLKYSKKVNGTYYVVEAIPESKYKKFWVVSAYMEAGGGTQAPNAVRPGNTSGTSLASSPPAGFSVPQSGNSVNQNISPNDMGAMRSQFESVPKQAQTQSNTIGSMEADWNVPESQRTPIMYDTISEAKSLDNARLRLAQDYAGEMAELRGKHNWSGEEVDMGMTILDNYRRAAEQTGDWTEYSNWRKEVSAHGTAAGQALQAYAKYSRQTGGGIVADASAALERAAKKTNKAEVMNRVNALAQQYDAAIGTGQENAKVNVNDLVDIIKSASTTRQTGTLIGNKMPPIVNWAMNRIANYARSEAQTGGGENLDFLKTFAADSIYNIAADTSAVSAGEKVKTVRRMGMLSKVSTVMRNLVSNNVFDPVDSVARNVSVPLDMLVSTITGTRSVAGDASWFSAAKRKGSMDGLARACMEVGLDVDTSGGAGKYENTANRTFKMSGGVFSKLMSTWEAYEGYTLNATDEFQKGGIEASVQQGIDRLYERGKIKDDSLRDAGKQEALYRTFQDKTVLSDAAIGVRNALNKAHIGDVGAGDIVLPFAQVPSNLGARAIEYSPAGLIVSAADFINMIDAAKKGNLTAAQQAKAVQGVGRVLTGSGMIAIAAAGALRGWLKVTGDDEDKNKDALGKTHGLDGTQLNISAAMRDIRGEGAEWQDGDTLLSIGFLDPLNAQLTTGALIADDIRSEEGVTAGRVLGNSLSGALQSVLDTPVMSTFQDVASSYEYSDASTTGGKVLDAAQKYAANQLSSVIPNSLRGIAQGLDDTERNAYSSDNVWQQAVDNAKASIPGLRETLPAKTDVWGNPVKNEGGVRNFMNRNINPGNITTYKTDAVSSEIEKISEATGTSLYPDRTAPRSLKVDGEAVSLTFEQRSMYQKAYGDAYSAAVTSLMNDKNYKAMPDSMKAEILKQAKDVAAERARDSLGVGYEVKSSAQKILEKSGAGRNDAIILAAVKSQHYLSDNLQTQLSNAEKQYSGANYARQSLELVESAKEKATTYFEHAEQAKYGGELTETEQELVGKDSEYIADYFMRKAIDGYKNADGTTGHLSGENAVQYGAVAKSFDTPLFSAVTDDLLAQAKKKAHAFYTEVEKTDFGGVMSADNRALNRKFAKMGNDEIAQYFLSVAAKEKFKDTNGNGTNLDEAAAALKSGDITDPTVFAFLDSDVVEDYTRYGKGSSITPEILLHAARAKKTVKQDTDQDGVVVNTSQEQFEDWVNRQSWTQQQKRDVMKVFYPNTAEKKAYLVESLNNGKMKYSEAKKELTPTLQAGWTHQLLPTLAENANDTTKGVLMSQYIEAAAAYDDRPNASERKALNYSYAWQWFCDYLNTTDMTREQKYQVALIMSGTDSQKTKDKIWSRLR